MDEGGEMPPSGFPETHVQTVIHGGETITMRLAKQDLRGSHFELWAQNSSGTYDVIAAVEERSYLGTVDEYSGAVAFGIFQDNGQFRGGVIFDRGASWSTLDTDVTKTRGFTPPDAFGFPEFTVAAGQTGTTMYGFDVGLDARHDYFSARGGSSVAKTFEHIEYSVAATRALYMSNALLRPYLGRVIIRTSSAQDPYTGTTTGTYLNALQTEWNTNHADAQRVVVGGVSADSVGGGLAWIETIGTERAYSINDSAADGDFSVVWRHELGHNWGMNHYDGGAPEGDTINSNNQYNRMSGPELRLLLDHRDSRLGILQSDGTYTAVDVPPYASIDRVVFAQGSADSLAIDVLANDHDANGQSLSIGAFEATSSAGGTVTMEDGGLVYTPPSTYFLGIDTFTYAAADTTGLTATGVVAVSVQPNEALRLYLPLNENSGTTVLDASAFELTGTRIGGDLSTASVPGAFGRAVNFNGFTEAVAVPGVDFQGNTLTMIAWIKAGALQKDFSGILFDRSGTHAAGLNIQSNRALRYHWWDQAMWAWDSGLIVPANTWTFVALVIQPDRATIHMNSGSGLQSATNIAAHSAEQTLGTLFAGQDPNFPGVRNFNGAIDEVRVYNYAMSTEELGLLFAGGIAETPKPLNNASVVASQELAWTPGAGATENQIYIGTSQGAVEAANPTSPEFAGATVDPFFTVALEAATTYYWRVDTVTASETLKGVIWSFATGAAPVVNAGPDEATVISSDAPWTPADITSVVGWYDANDATTVTTSSGSAVSQWADKSRHETHLSQSSEAARPQLEAGAINGLDAINFTGQRLNSASNPFGASIHDALVMCVHRVDAVSNGTLFTLSGSHTDPNRWQSHAPWGDDRIYFDNGTKSPGDRLQTAYDVAAGASALVGFYASTTENVQQLFKNGALLAENSSARAVPAVGDIVLASDGGGTYQNTTIGEFIIIDGTVTLETREKLEGYLAHKWGLAVDLPAAHPHKAAAPIGGNAVVVLNGDASDPDGTMPTTAWTLQSGPASVAFGDASTAETTATFTEAGIYVLRLTADDGLSTTFDEVTVAITEAGEWIDTNDNGIDDVWEMESFDRLLEEEEPIDESGVPYFFMYLHGTDLSDPSDRFRFVAEPDGNGEVAVSWVMRDQFQLGIHYDIRLSTDLTDWDPIPQEHYTVEQVPATAGRTRLELTLTHDYGDRVFLRLIKP